MQLLNIFDSFVRAKTPSQGKRIVKQHPELLSEEFDDLLEQHIIHWLTVTIPNEESDRLLEPIIPGLTNGKLAAIQSERRDLLRRCRTDGVDAAFAPLLQASPVLGLSEQKVGIPAEFDAEMQELMRLHSQAQRNPSLHSQQTTLSDEALRHLRASQQNELGITYVKLSTGNRVDNLRQAIACFEEALRFYTPEAAPFDYARTQNNLGNAYSDLPTGDRTANLRHAIACFGEALRFHTPEANPFEYAQTQNNLGNAYSDLPIGDREANQRQAIACYEEALRFHTPEAAPLDYATTQNNLGIAYKLLPTGNQTANLRKAITCYEEALRFHTPETAPFDYARTQNNLGLAYSDLLTGDRADNLRKAIACFEEALRFYTLEADPYDFLKTTLNLGNLHFRERDWEEAHSAYAMACSPWEARYLAAATEVARQAELSESLDLFLNDAYCLAKLGHFTDALKLLDSAKARALSETLTRDRADLELATLDDRKVFEAARVRTKALEAEARAMGVEEDNRKVFEASSAKALEALTMGVDEDDRKALEAEARAMGIGNIYWPTKRSFTEISAELRNARQELVKVADRIRTYVSNFMPMGLDFKAIAAAVAPSSPLIYLITTSQGSLALILLPEAESLGTEHALWLDDFNADDLNDLLLKEDVEGNVSGGYLVEQRGKDISRFQIELEQVLPILGERLMGPLVVRLADLGFQQVTLVLGGRLSLLPLHAATYSTAGKLHTFLHDFEVSYVPCARALSVSRQAAKAAGARPPTFFAVADPSHTGASSLPFAQAEVENICPLFPDGSSFPLYGKKATKTAAMKGASGHTHLHFSCHGYFDSLKPLHSALLLTGKGRLTLQDILDKVDFKGTRLAVLSACQTAIADFRHIPDEAVGLPSGFLQAGVPGVIGSLWPVSDVSTSLLMIRFYQLHLGKVEGSSTSDSLPPSAALRLAQLWLKDVTAAELADYFARHRELLRPGGFRSPYSRVSEQWRHFSSLQPHARPFAHPLYWAAFTFNGI